MKIKSIIGALLTALFFVSCSSDGSRTIQLDEFASIDPSSDWKKIEDCQKTAELFSIVPGEYTISWAVRDKLPQQTNYTGTMVIKLRLNKKVNVKEEYITSKYMIYTPTFYLVDADGKLLREGCKWYSNYFDDENNSRDQFMNWVKFLQSDPGTEMEFTLGTLLMEASDEKYAQDITNLKRAKGICLFVETDKDFFDNVGEIVE